MSARFVIILLIGLITSNYGSSQNEVERITPRLQQKINKRTGEPVSIIILLKDKIQTDQLEAEYQRQGLSFKERVSDLIPRLRHKAAFTQSGLLNDLMFNSSVIKKSIKPFWIANLIAVKVYPEEIYQLARDDRVETLFWDAPLQRSSENDITSTNLKDGSAELGLKAINAEALWKMGYTGYGTVAFVNDSGVDLEHPSLKHRFRGHNDPGSVSWFEPVITNEQPRDCIGHGTHVLGIIVGLDRERCDTTGVAFDAQWVGSTIACRISTSDNIASLQWALDPDQNPGTIDDMPDVINHSWYDPDPAIAQQECTSVYVDVVNAIEATGKTTVIWSAGNAGPGPMTILPPQNINTDIVNIFTVGSVNGDLPTFPISIFSSRGPSRCGGGGSLEIKPEVSAPGDQIRSCSAGGGFGFLSGTSMAAPHVCGAVLLLREAFPDATGNEIKRALYFTCQDLGVPGEDNEYGMGIIDVKSAFDYLLDQGHNVFDPLVTHNAVLYNVIHQSFECQEEISASASVMNDGIFPITSMKVKIFIDNPGFMSDTLLWNGNLMPGSFTQIELPVVSLTKGSYTYGVSIIEVNDSLDGRPLNNQILSLVNVLDRIPEPAFVQSFPNLSYCVDSRVLLESATSENIHVKWFDSIDSEIPFAEGVPVLTSPLSSNTTVYAEYIFSDSIGPEAPIGTMKLGNAPNSGLQFDALGPFEIKSVRVYAEESGFRSISLFYISDVNQPETIVKKSINIPAGSQVVDLGFKVSPRKNLYLGLTGKPLYFTEGGVDFPIQIDGVLTLKGSNHSNHPDRSWLYFYDWEIEFSDPCGRQAVDIQIDTSLFSPESSFETLDTIFAIGETVIFVNHSTNAIEWLWDFGDGNVSSEEHPDHIFTEPGIYNVRLSAISNEWCIDHFEQIVIVEPDSTTNVEDQVESLFSVFPNPSEGVLFVEAKDEISEWTMFDLSGLPIESGTPSGFEKNHLKLIFDRYATGIYFLGITIAGKHYYAKVLLAP